MLLKLYTCIALSDTVLGTDRWENNIFLATSIQVVFYYAWLTGIYHITIACQHAIIIIIILCNNNNIIIIYQAGRAPGTNNIIKSYIKRKRSMKLNK